MEPAAGACAHPDGCLAHQLAMRLVAAICLRAFAALGRFLGLWQDDLAESHSPSNSAVAKIKTSSAPPHVHATALMDTQRFDIISPAAKQVVFKGAWDLDAELGAQVQGITYQALCSD